MVDNLISMNKNYKRKGFTYIELITGISILLLGFSFFIVIIRYYSINKETVKNTTKMVNIAQNSVNIYNQYNKVTQQSIALSSTISSISSNYPDYIVAITESSINISTNIYKTEISIYPKDNNLNIPNYTLVYYRPDSSIVQ